MTTAIFLGALAFLTFIFAGDTKPASAEQSCKYDEAAMLLLSEKSFDQDLANGGWRSVDAKPGCELAAADLIKKYRELHGDVSILFWHEGQLRAFVGDYTHAVPLLSQSRVPAADDWNLYVDATVAFLQRDEAALRSARSKLAVVQPPSTIVVKNGFIELPNRNEQAPKIPWPPNLDVVDGLIRCFDKAYKIAYGSKDCRAPTR